jgi:hypothetical protein
LEDEFINVDDNEDEMEEEVTCCSFPDNDSISKLKIVSLSINLSSLSSSLLSSSSTINSTLLLFIPEVDFLGFLDFSNPVYSVSE